MLGIPRLATRIPRNRLFPSPAGAFFGILDNNSQSGKLVADAVAAGKITGPASLLSLCQKGVDLLIGEGIGGHHLRRRLISPAFVLRPLQRAPGYLSITILKDTKDFIETAKRLHDGRDVIRKKLARVGGNIPVAHQVKDRGPGIRGV